MLSSRGLSLHDHLGIVVGEVEGPRKVRNFLHAGVVYTAGRTSSTSRGRPHGVARWSTTSTKRRQLRTPARTWPATALRGARSGPSASERPTPPTPRRRGSAR